MDFLSIEVQNTLQKIQQTHNILIIFHPSKPDEKRYFIVSSFTPAQNQIFEHTLKGKEITELLTSNYLTALFGNSLSIPVDFVQRQTFETKIEELKERQLKFSKDYSYEWWLS